MGLHEGAPKFVAPQWADVTDEKADATRSAAVIRQAERDVAEKIRTLCNAALMRIAETDKYRHEASPLAAHFMAHRYVDRIIIEGDMHKSPGLHALAWDARGLRWQIESLSPMPAIEHAFILMRDDAGNIAAGDSE